MSDLESEPMLDPDTPNTPNPPNTPNTPIYDESEPSAWPRPQQGYLLHTAIMTELSKARPGQMIDMVYSSMVGDPKSRIEFLGLVLDESKDITINCTMKIAKDLRTIGDKDLAETMKKKLSEVLDGGDSFTLNSNAGCILCEEIESDSTCSLQ